MVVIVEDTNILIDLVDSGLITHCDALDIEFHTTDMVISELRNSNQRLRVLQSVENGRLKVAEIKNQDLIDVSLTYYNYSRSTNLSIADISVMLQAERLKCRLLTSDQKLLNQARQRGIEANGLLWLTDYMVDSGTVQPLMMVSYLQKLLTTNDCAPRHHIMERIERYMRNNR